LQTLEKGDRSGSEGAVGEVESGAKEKGCLVAGIANGVFGADQLSIGNRTLSGMFWHFGHCLEQPIRNPQSLNRIARNTAYLADFSGVVRRFAVLRGQVGQQMGTSISVPAFNPT
jgi:hypothetical protein